MLRSIEPHFKRIAARVLRLFTGPRVLSDFSSTPLNNILVVRQHNQLGDMLCAVPLLRALRLKFPHAFITLLASPVNKDVMQHNMYLDRIIVYDKREFLENGKLHLLKLLRFIRNLRSEKHDIAIVPSTVSTSFTSDMLAYLSGARIRIGASEVDGRENSSSFFFNAPVRLDWRDDPHRPQTMRNLDIAGALSLSTSNLASEITLTAAERREGRHYVENVRGTKKISIGLHPGAGKVGNRWPASSFAEVANTLSREFNAAIFVTAGPMDDEPLENTINKLNISFELVQNQSIRTVASIVFHLDLFITNDTGLMHVAGAMGVPVLSLFGPTDPKQWAPCGSANRYIAGEGAKIDAIRVRDVLDAAREMLAERR